jgi:hypothetical protein
MGQALHGKKEEHFLHPKSKLVYCDRNNLAHPLSLQWRICHERKSIFYTQKVNWFIAIAII